MADDRMAMKWRLACALGVVMASAPLSTTAARAECLSAAFDASQLLRDSALLFAGTLVDGDDYTLTFIPDRVWKGTPSARATVYLIGHPFVDSYRFRPGQRYLVSARVLQKEERWAINIDDGAPTAFGIERPCGAPLPLSLVPALDKKLAHPH